MRHLRLLETKIERQEAGLVGLQQYEVPDMLVYHWLQGKLHFLKFGVEVVAYPSKQPIMDHCSLAGPCHTLDINVVEDALHT